MGSLWQNSSCLWNTRQLEMWDFRFVEWITKWFLVRESCAIQFRLTVLHFSTAVECCFHCWWHAYFYIQWQLTRAIAWYLWYRSSIQYIWQLYKFLLDFTLTWMNLFEKSQIRKYAYTFSCFSLSGPSTFRIFPTV